MNTFKTKTGYFKCITDGVVFKGDIAYLGKFDSASNYKEATKEEYDEYLMKEEEKANADRH